MKVVYYYKNFINNQIKKIIDKNFFVKVILDKNIKTLIIDISFLIIISIYLYKKFQIIFLLTKKVIIVKIFLIFLNFS